MRTVDLRIDKFLVGKLLASGTVDGQFVELDLAPLITRSTHQLHSYVGCSVRVSFTSLKVWEMHMFGIKHNTHIELKNPTIEEIAIK